MTPSARRSRRAWQAGIWQGLRDGSGRRIRPDCSPPSRTFEALCGDEERLGALLDALSAGVVVHNIDTHVESANAAACELLGHPLADLVGKHAHHEIWQFVRDDETPMAPAELPVMRVRADGRPVRNAPLGIRRPTAPEIAWVVCNAYPVSDARGVPRQIVVTFGDITARKLAQDALQASEERLRMASRLARLANWRIDIAQQHITLPAEFAHVLGAGATQMSLDDALAQVAPEDRADLQRRLLQAFVDGRPIDTHFAVRRADECAAHLRIVGEAVRDAGGRIVALQGAMQDMTEQRRAQQQLRLLEAAVAGLNDAVLITEAEPVGEPGPRTVFVNDAYERLTGYRRADILGRSPRLMQGPETAGAELDRLREAIRQQRPVRVELVNYGREGQRYWLELSMVPLVDASGRATHFVAVQRDISQRKTDEAAVAAAQRELAATLAAVPDLLLDVDLDGRVHQCHLPRNDQALAEVFGGIGRRLPERLPPALAAPVMAALAEAERQGHSAGIEYELDGAGGKKRWFELSVSGKAAPPGESPRFILLARDVSERRQIEIERRLFERQLREVQKMESIGTLAGGIAHDFNNILAAILGNVELARGEIAAGHPVQSNLAQIAKAGMRARSLVQQILAFSSRRPSALRPRALRPVVEETVALMRATLPAAVRLETRVSEDELVVSTDATQLQQVLMNLCTNAWHALPAGGGRIEIGLEPLPAGVVAADFAPGRAAHLWVADNGSGMDAAMRSRIFDPFFTTKPVGQGTGLGLSVVHGIVRSHLGTISVDSTPGEGSTFHLYFPLVDAPAVDAGPGPGPLASQATMSPFAPPAPADREQRAGERILYVDDDEVMLLMVQRLLQRAGYRIVGVAGAEEALALVGSASEPFDLVISDFNMPDMSGLDLAEHLHRLHPDLPLIITTGFVTDQLRTDALRLGVRALLRKEHTIEKLADLVVSVLESASRPGLVMSDARQGRVETD